MTHVPSILLWIDKTPSVGYRKLSSKNLSLEDSNVQKFLVVSYDPDDQSWYWDFVVADDEGDAEEKVCQARLYVTGASAASEVQLDKMSQALDETSAARIEYNFRELTETLHQCQDCQRHFNEDALINPVPDIEQRVAPGEPMPSGECPDCGAVCHKMERPK
jgi:hypothetical protein